MWFLAGMSLRDFLDNFFGGMIGVLWTIIRNTLHRFYTSLNYGFFLVRSWCAYRTWNLTTSIPLTLPNASIRLLNRSLWFMREWLCSCFSAVFGLCSSSTCLSFTCTLACKSVLHLYICFPRCFWYLDDAIAILSSTPDNSAIFPHWSIAKRLWSNFVGLGFYTTLLLSGHDGL